MNEDAEQPDTVRERFRRGRTVAFTPIEPDDAGLIQRWRSDPVAAHETGIWPGALYELRERIEGWIEDRTRDDFLVLLADGTPAGHVSLSEEDFVDGTAEAYLLLAPEHRGQGYAADALAALTDLAFGELPLQRVEAVTHTDNTAALAVLSGAGFVQEGVRRSACLCTGAAATTARCSPCSARSGRRRAAPGPGNTDTVGTPTVRVRRDHPAGAGRKHGRPQTGVPTRVAPLTRAAGDSSWARSSARSRLAITSTAALS
ncbi:GNAT family N-acetyltransferase [Streptomyces sp. NBC_01433]|nr:GNAT family N-acetyltransferase [Streptomyces sp. NBC_01433]